MTSGINFSAIHVRDINLWSHVGVLDVERLQGQKFILDISFWVDVDAISKYDDITLLLDYSLVIDSIQKFSLKVKCLTIEFFSDQILDIIEGLYGPIPMQIHLKKCSPPINGFTGNVSIERSRYSSLLNS